MAKFSRDAPATEAPRDPWQLSDTGQLSSITWIRFFQQLVRGAKAVYDLGALQIYDPAPVQDPEPRMRAIAEALRDPDGAGRHVQDVQDTKTLAIAGFSAQRQDEAEPPPFTERPAYDDSEIRSLLASIDDNQGRGANGPQVFAGRHAERLSSYPAAAYPQGSRFFEIDRTLIYIDVGGVWKYAAGQCVSTQATLPADLTASDAGAIAAVTDFGHRLRWDGAAWTWAPGDPQSGYTALFEVDPAGPEWHICDGSTVTYLRSDGATGSLTLPDLTGGAYLKTGATNSGPDAATAPAATVAGSATAASAITGLTNPATTGASGTGISGGVTGATTPTVTIGVNDAQTGNGAGSTGFVASSPHSHTVTSSPHSHTISGLSDPTHSHTIAAPTDPGHTHTIDASHLTVTADATGEPRHITRRVFFRR